MAISLSANKSFNWQHKKWKTDSLDNGYVRYITNGSVTYGNKFGFILHKSNCSNNNLWLSIATYEKGLREYVGKEIEFEMQVDDFTDTIKLTLSNVIPVLGHIDSALFTNYLVNERFLKLLEKSSKITFTIKKPDDIMKKFDIPYEMFSLNGFMANKLKATETCYNLNKLSTFTKIK